MDQRCRRNAWYSNSHNFTSAKPYPNDYDGVWEQDGGDEQLVDEVLLDFSLGGRVMNNKCVGELFRADDRAAMGMAYRDFFRQTDDGTPKGILLIDLTRVR